MEADARAMQILEQLAKMTSPVDSAKVSLDDVLIAFHGARDKHIFRILATIVDPSHTSQARIRALEELPKRTKALGDTVADWVKNLVKRCAMGDSLNADVVCECIRLAKGCLLDNNIAACGAMLATVQMTVNIFPSICTPILIGELASLFLQCRSLTGTVKKTLHTSGIVTALSCILSVVSNMEQREGPMSPIVQSSELKEQLMQLCTRDGTPQQARNAAYTLVHLFNNSDQLATVTSRNEYFAPLLRTLSSTSRFNLLTDKKDGMKVVRSLSALAALTDFVPTVFTSSHKGEMIVKFALEAILMGQNQIEDERGSDENESINENESEPLSPSPGKRRASTATCQRNRTPDFNGDLVEVESLSVTCRQICAAADFLVSYVRSTHLQHVLQTTSGTNAETDKVTLSSTNQVRLLFQLLVKILINQGLPPSSSGRKLCSSRQDRAALRQCSAISLLRMCDTRLGLEQEMLSKNMWHTLGTVLLDEEKVVRVAVMEELSSMYKGLDAYGTYMTLPPKAPSLRFLSYIALCCDGDRDQDVANGHSANVGRVISLTKVAATNCIINLRKVTEATYTHCCALGKEAETRFENHVKMLITPEYCLPFAFHLLSHRSETPSEEADSDDDASDGDDEMSNNTGHVTRTNDGRKRTLRKRLKVLLDALVQTLGDRANNISFLLRMTEILGRHYIPVDVSATLTSQISGQKRRSIDSDGNSTDCFPSTFCSSKSHQLEARLKTICSVAREILLSYVKSDVNLSTYPGTIQLPASLFTRSDLGTIRVSHSIAVSKATSSKKSNAETINTPLLHSNDKKKANLLSPRQSQAPQGSSLSRSGAKIDVRVTFSPVIQYNKEETAEKFTFGNASPIPNSNTPNSESGYSGHRSTRSGVSTGCTTEMSRRTLGTTPPDHLATGTTIDESSSNEGDLAPTKPHRITAPITSDGIYYGALKKKPIVSKPTLTTPNSEASVAVTLTQTSMPPKMRRTSPTSRQSSQASHSEQTSTTSSGYPRTTSRQSSQTSHSELSSTASSGHPRKRRELHRVVLSSGPPSTTAKRKKMQRNTSLPPQISVNYVAKKRNKRTKGDELDFERQDENVPISRNQGKGDKIKSLKTTSKASTAKTKSKATNFSRARG
jgi:hypothetical protein